MEESSYRVVDAVRGGMGKALATIVDVEGSAYRKKDAMMLICTDGRRIGVLSAGCLEEDVCLQAEGMIADGENSRLLTYDMSEEDDLGWSIGNGCQGKVYVLLEKMTSILKENIVKIQNALDQGMSVTAYKSLTQIPGSLHTYYITQKGGSFGAQLGSDTSCYVQSFEPKQRLIIFGAGEDVPALCTFAYHAGFDTHVWDWRDARLNKKDLPHVTFLRKWDGFHYLPSDMVVIMTHVFEKDQTLLRYFLNGSIALRYIGVMGPVKRTKRLLETEVLPNFLHNPIGIEIGAEGAVEIAVSIMAELIQVKREVTHEQHDRNLSCCRNKQTLWKL